MMSASRAAAALVAILTTCSRPRYVSGVLNGNHILATSMPSSPFRGAVQSGGGTGMVLFVAGDEAVILTVAHGYDLTTKNATEVMDFKQQYDGGLKAAMASTATTPGYATSAGQPSIIAENLGLWRFMTFGDAQSCPAMNAARHSGALDDPFGCDGVGPDVDLAMQRVRLTPAAAALGFPTLGLHLDPLTPGMDVTVVGFGRTNPCNAATDASWASSAPDALKTGRSQIRGVFATEAMAYGLSSPGVDLASFGCSDGESVLSCGQDIGAVAADADFGERWGQGCSGDSGAAWLTEGPAPGRWSVIGVNRGPGKNKDESGNWIQDEDTTFRDMCAGNSDGAGDACQTYGTAISTLYPARKKIRQALADWGYAGQASALSYTCEPPAPDNGACGSGCHLCSAGGVADCFPEGWSCPTLETLGSNLAFVCGDALQTDSVPSRQCSGGDGAGPICRGLPTGQGWLQQQICQSASAAGECPGLTFCCSEQPRVCGAHGSPGLGPTPAPTQSPPELCFDAPITSFCHGVRNSGYWGPNRPAP